MNINQFTAAMTRYAKLQPSGAPDFSDEWVAKFWFEEVGHYGTQALGEAMKKLVAKSRFPCISDVKAHCGDSEISDEVEARDVADRIHHAVGYYGRMKWNEAKIYIGPIGVKVVDGCGGWASLCSTMTMDNTSIYKAQFRESAKVYMIKAKAGLLDTPPQLPEPVKGAGAKAMLAAASEAEHDGRLRQVSAPKVSETGNAEPGGNDND